MRLDQALAHLKIAPSRTKAQELIRNGGVEILRDGEWKAITDVSISVDNLTRDQIRLRENEILKYVSRGGLKLEGALKHTGIDVEGARCLDVGQSTGGFTHCLLEHGARVVVGFDVGKDQLHESLRQHPQVKFYEGIHVKDAARPPEMSEPFDLCVVDVSFISLKQVIPALKGALKGKCTLLALVKPQFELDAKSLNKKGVVKDEKLLHSVKSEICNFALEQKCKILDYFPSSVKGQDGNQEFFLHAEIQGTRTS